MGWISMSERDLRRIEVLSDVRAGRRTVAAAAAVLAVSERQTYRLLARYELLSLVIPCWFCINRGSLDLAITLCSEGRSHEARTGEKKI